jgi:hypothetical protein
MIRNILIFVIVALISSIEVEAQPTTTVKKDTVIPFLLYPGTVQYSYYKKDDKEVIHGGYNFISSLVIDGEKINQMKINGRFVHGKKNGIWNFEEDDYQMRVNSLQNLRPVTTLDGWERKFVKRYQNGVPEGKWEINSNVVRNSLRTPMAISSVFNFKKGIATGSFIFNEELNGQKVSVTAQLTKNGFFDGICTIHYSVDSNNLRIEERKYWRGFLLELKKIDAQTGDVLQLIEYTDVAAKLKAFNSGSDTINFTISEKGFGAEFNNGYLKVDPRLLEQNTGNEIINRIINYASRFSEDTSQQSGVQQPIFMLTRRFQFLYDQEEDSLVAHLNKLINNQIHLLDSVLNYPRFVINKSREDSLAHAHAYFLLSKEKLEQIAEVIHLIEDGFFFYQNRNDFYADGVQGLKKVDTMHYQFNGKVVERIFDPQFFITSPQNLLKNLTLYSGVVDKQSHVWLEFIQKKLRYFGQEELLDSIDLAILNLSKKLESRYEAEMLRRRNLVTPRGAREPLNILPKMYDNIIIKELEALINNYSKEYVFAKKKEIGEYAVLLLTTFDEDFGRIIQIERMPQNLDSAFTRYIENPFYTRMAESRIKPHIYNRGAVRLFNFYVDGLQKATYPADIQKRVEEIFALHARLIELAESNDPEVVKINQRLRRENVPDRIKRYLGL